MTSAGQIVPMGPTPYFVLIDRALRDEGTSHHYLPPIGAARAWRTCGGNGGHGALHIRSGPQAHVLCFVYVTNQMAVAEGDFEKGEADDALDVIATAARACGFA